VGVTVGAGVLVGLAVGTRVLVGGAVGVKTTACFDGREENMIAARINAIPAITESMTQSILDERAVGGEMGA
jgi:hypothetical protein